LPAENPGVFNEALMDLGSAICTPQNPACPECPVQTECAAFKHGTTGQFPVKKRKTKVRNIYYLAYALQDPAGELLLERRPDQGLLAKMWQFPLVEIEKKEYLKLRETIDEGQRAHFAASLAESGKRRRAVCSTVHTVSDRGSDPSFFASPLAYPALSRQDRKAAA
jgi:adenine-specific DNA glycosylase